MNINSELLKGIQKLGLAVSGGADSMALLDWAIINLKDIRLTVLNINHNLRPKSKQESKFVEDYCKKQGIDYVLREIERGALGNSGIENKAREFRNQFFSEKVKDGTVDAVATAHHALDNAETILLHILRGSGLNGARGMRERSGFIIRPMLNVPKEEIDEYIKKRNIPFCLDESNLESIYNRNYLRNKVFPVLEQRFSGVAKQICAFGALASADDEFIESSVPSVRIIAENTALIEAKHFSVHRAVLNRLIFRALRALGKDKDIELRHIELIASLTQKNATGKKADIKKGLKAVRDVLGVVIFCTDKSNEGNGEEGKPPLKDSLSEKIKELKLYQKSPVLTLDKQAVPKSAIWRTREQGDSFLKFGGVRTKLKEYYIDLKIPERLRDYVPILCDGKNVLLIAGFEISDSVRITEKTKEKIEITLDNYNSIPL